MVWQGGTSGPKDSGGSFMDMERVVESGEVGLAVWRRMELREQRREVRTLRIACGCVWEWKNEHFWMCGA